MFLIRFKFHNLKIQNISKFFSRKLFSTKLDYNHQTVKTKENLKVELEGIKNSNSSNIVRRENLDQGVNELNKYLKSVINHKELIRDEFSIFETNYIMKKTFNLSEKFLLRYFENCSLFNILSNEKNTITILDIMTNLNNLSKIVKSGVSAMNPNSKFSFEDINKCLNSILIFLINRNLIKNSDFQLFENKENNVVSNMGGIFVIFEYFDLSLMKEDELKKYIELFNVFSNFCKFDQKIFDKFESFFEDKLKDIDTENINMINSILTCILKNKSKFPKFSDILYSNRELFFSGKSFNEMQILFNELFSVNTNVLKNISNNELNNLFNLFLEESNNIQVKPNETTNLLLFYLNLLNNIVNNNLNFNLMSTTKNKLQNNLFERILNCKIDLNTVNNLHIILELSHIIPTEQTGKYFQVIRNLINNNRNKEIKVKIINYFGFNYTSNSYNVVNSVARNLSFTSKENLSYQEVVFLIFSLAVHNSKNYSRIINEIKPLIGNEKILDIIYVSMILFANTKMLNVKDFDNYEYYIKFLLIYNESTFKDPLMLNLYPKLMWTICNFVINTNDANPVFKHMLQQFPKIISSVIQPNREDANYILQTLYFIDKMIKKGLLGNYIKLEDIFPRNIVFRYLSIKKKNKDYDINFLNDLKIVGDILLDNRVEFKTCAIVENDIIDFIFPKIPNTGLILVNDNDFLKEDFLNYDVLFLLKYYKEKKYDVMLINVDEIRRNNQEEIKKLKLSNIKKDNLFKI